MPVCNNGCKDTLRKWQRNKVRKLCLFRLRNIKHAVSQSLFANTASNFKHAYNTVGRWRAHYLTIFLNGASKHKRQDIRTTTIQSDSAQWSMRSSVILCLQTMLAPPPQCYLWHPMLGLKGVTKSTTAHLCRCGVCYVHMCGVYFFDTIFARILKPENTNKGALPSLVSKSCVVLFYSQKKNDSWLAGHDVLR